MEDGMANEPVNSNKPWTTSEIAELRKLANGNTPTPLIAYKLGRSIPAIYNEANKKNIPLTPTNKSPYNRRKSK
jgi:hypothetical protein